MNNNMSHEEKRRRKALLMLPLLVVPFITLGFWALGGGRGGGKEMAATGDGLNLSLPDASGKTESALDKLRFYEQADRDSAEWRRKMAQDRYSLGYRDEDENAFVEQGNSFGGYNPGPPAASRSSAETERLIYQKLGEINQQISSKPQEQITAAEYVGQGKGSFGQSAAYPKVLQPEREHRTDSDLVVLDQMMNKILDIQHPERVKSRMEPEGKKPKVDQSYKVTDQPGSTVAYFGGQSRTQEPGAAFSTAPLEQREVQEWGITAAIHNQQLIQDGSVVHLRLLQPFYINSIKVPEGTMVHGAAAIREDRLMITIASIVLNHTIYPVSMVVYDLDGMEGIHVPKQQERKTISESLSNSMQSMPLITVDPSLKGQAATAGAQAVKALVSRKSRQVKVTLPQGYQVILKQSK